MGTHYQGTEEEELALDTYSKLMRCAESLTARVHQHLADVGLTVRQFAVLETLYHLGPMCQRAIAEKLLRSTANLTLVIDNLEKRGLVKRIRSKTDRRFITVFLTDEGRALIAEVFPRHVSILVHQMQILSKDEQRELGRLCKKLGLQDGLPEVHPSPNERESKT